MDSLYFGAAWPRVEAKKTDNKKVAKKVVEVKVEPELHAEEAINEMSADSDDDSFDSSPKQKTKKFNFATSTPVANIKKKDKRKKEGKEQMWMTVEEEVEGDEENKESKMVGKEVVDEETEEGASEETLVETNDPQQEEQVEKEKEKGVAVKGRERDGSSECKICNERFSSQTMLAYHYTKHTEIRADMRKKFSELFKKRGCVLCDKQVASKNNLVSHIAVKHEKLNVVLKARRPPIINFAKRDGEGKIIGAIRRKKKTKKSEPEKSHSTVKAIEGPPALEAKNRGPTTPNKSCPFCSSLYVGIGNVKQHVVDAHFSIELKAICAPYMSDCICKVCDLTVKKRCHLVRHVAIKHGHLERLLRAKGHTNLNIMDTSTDDPRKEARDEGTVDEEANAGEEDATGEVEGDVADVEDVPSMAH